MIPTISFYVFKKRQSKRGEVKVYLRFTNDRKSNYKSTNVSVPSNMWDHNKQKVKSAYKLSNATNMLLERKISEVREELMHSALKNKHISSKQARNIAFSKTNLSFFKIADEYVAKFLKDEKFGSYDKYKSIYSKFGIFLGGRGATFYDIDTKSLNDFQYYLKTECKNKVNTIHNN